jgi:hypothetical protein
MQGISLINKIMVIVILWLGITEVLSGDGGVVATSCLHFLVTASIGTVGEGCRVCAFSELLWLSNFNSTDEIRNLEYDLMDNVTQRQNHISGLSEGFTYDALDRLTQSSTTVEW